MPAYLWDRKFLHATAVMVGTMVGVGIYGIPFVFAKAGVLVGTGFLVFAGVVTALFNLLFSELILRTPGTHQLPGIAGAYLGRWAKLIVFLCNLIGIYGALLTYVIYSGGFMHTVFSQFMSVEPRLYSVLFIAVLAPILLFRLRTIAWVEMAMATLFVAVMGGIVLFGAQHIRLENYVAVTGAYWFLPYGVLIFAFAGLSCIPIQRQILRGREELLRPSILWAVIGVGILYLLFAFTVVGITGDTTTPDVFTGLMGAIDGWVVLLGSAFGILTTATSYIMLSTALSEMFSFDYRVSRWTAWLLTIVPPLLLYLAELRNPIDIIGLVGAVAIGLESAIFIGAYLYARHRGQRDPEFRIRVPSIVLYALAVLFLGGVFYQFLQ